MPAVAIATVRQASRATMARNSGLHFGRKKIADETRRDFKIIGSEKQPGLELSGVAVLGQAELARQAPRKAVCAHAGSRSAGATKVAPFMVSAAPRNRWPPDREPVPSSAAATRLPASSCSNWAYNFAKRSRLTSAAGRSKANSPSRKPMMRGKRAATLTWCSVTTRVTPVWRAASVSVSMASLARVGSRAESGSSTNHNAAGASSARARPTRWRSPPESRSTRSHSLSAKVEPFQRGVGFGNAAGIDEGT